jgi:pimeloyl-ACP methyl ester carboxylesterase
MLAAERAGEGPPLLLLHGTTSSRRIWAPLISELAAEATVIAVDLPGHGESPATSFTPPEWARELAAHLDREGIEKAAVVGHSCGGWTALELAKLGRCSAVLALAPAGLWRKRSPLMTDLALNANWRLGRLLGARATAALRSPLVRALALRTISARPRAIAPQEAIDSARTAISTDSFPRHFAETRRLRFQHGSQIEVPVEVVWGERDRIALPGKSRSLDQLPGHVSVETWPDCGHMLMWDAPERVLESIRGISRHRSRAAIRGS